MIFVLTNIAAVIKLFLLGMNEISCILESQRVNISFNILNTRFTFSAQKLGYALIQNTYVKSQLAGLATKLRPRSGF